MSQEFQHPPHAIVLGTARIHANQVEQLTVLEAELEAMQAHLEKAS